MRVKARLERLETREGGRFPIEAMTDESLDAEIDRLRMLVARPGCRSPMVPTEKVEFEKLYLQAAQQRSAAELRTLTDEDLDTYIAVLETALCGSPEEAVNAVA